MRDVPFLPDLRGLGWNAIWFCQIEFVTSSLISQHIRLILLLQSAYCVRATRIFIKTYYLLKILAASLIIITISPVSHEAESAQKKLFMQLNSLWCWEKPRSKLRKHTHHSDLSHETRITAVAVSNSDRVTDLCLLHYTCGNSRNSGNDLLLEKRYWTICRKEDIIDFPKWAGLLHNIVNSFVKGWGVLHTLNLIRCPENSAVHETGGHFHCQNLTDERLPRPP